MKIGPLTVKFHRTVRVAEGRAPANLPPSLGLIQLFEVDKYRDRCPSLWEDEGVFLGLHDSEALWMSFHTNTPVALLVGAGAINAITGEKLGTRLAEGNYLVVPPQPWLDGFKGEDGSVYQFVATAYKQGKGLTVGEQLIGEESKTGGIGLALFDSKQPVSPAGYPSQAYGGAYDDVDEMKISMASAMPMAGAAAPENTMGPIGAAVGAKSGLLRTASVERQSFKEMGLGKGGKIIQKIYADPYGLDTWKELPSQTRAVYIVHAALLAEITGQPIQKPMTQEDYGGPWFGLHDADKTDVPGSGKFTGLKSVFAEETADEEIKTSK